MRSILTKVLFFSATMLVGATAFAQSALMDEGAAIRRQKLLRNERLELIGDLGTTAGEVYERGALIGLGARYYINDTLGAGLQLDIAPAFFDTSVTANFNADPTVDATFGHAALSTAVEVQYVPWVGKLNWVDRRVVRYDISTHLGLGGALRTSDSDALAGFKFGPTVGISLRFFYTDQVAFHVRATDYLYTAADVQSEKQSPDEAFSNHVVGMVGISYFIPSFVPLSK